MYLKRLSCNKSTFRTVPFKDGLNIIYARKSNPDDTDTTKTYNGVGKSLCMALVHFCLGSKANREFEKKLPDWEFSLDFTIGDKHYIARRNTLNQREILLNGDLHTLTSFHELMGSELFFLKPKTKFLKFRPLISRFIRPKKKSYISFDCYVDKEKDFNQLINNCYLLGLDAKYILNKYHNKKEYDRVVALKKEIEHDDTLHNYFKQEGELDINLIDTKEKIQKLEEKLRKFEVAEDYRKTRKEADLIDENLRKLDNDIVILDSAIKNIELSIKLKPDISKKQIIDSYNEAKVVLASNIIKTLDEVEKFHNSLLSDRSKRLLKEKIALSEEMKRNVENRTKLGSELDEKLKYLGTHGALEEHVTLTQKLTDLKIQLDKMNTYREMIHQFKTKASGIKIKMDEETLATDKYLDETNGLLEDNAKIFRSLSERFYESKPGGIFVVNNRGENRLRYNLVSHIDDDTSDGINSVKIFCFDMTLLKARHNHNVNFLFHDSRLFSHTDPRQKSTLFRLAYEETKNSKMQYISSVNEDQVLPIKSYYGEVDYKKIITDNIIIELTDESPQKKLLGAQIPMDYE